MQSLTVIIAGLVALGVLVFVHELGHFLVAKGAGIRVLKFSLGFGPRLLGFKRGDTEYQLALLPLGGFVKMAGENPQEAEGQPVQAGDYFSRAWYIRLLVLLAGPAMNFVAAIVILTGLFTAGFQVPLAKPQVLAVEAGSPAALAGLQLGDVLVSLQDEPLEDWERFADQLNTLCEKSPNLPLRVSVQRSGTVLTQNLQPRREARGQRWRIGIEIGPAASTLIDRVFVGTPAEMAGFKPRDQVVAVQGQPVWTKRDFQRALQDRVGELTRIEVRRGDERLTLEVSPIRQDVPGVGKTGVIGVSFKMSDQERRLQYPFFQALALGTTQTFQSARLILVSLGQMLTGQISAKDSVGGPITIMRMAGQEVKAGLKDYLFFLASISIMLAVLNLLPIPLLDGGTAVFFILEGILRRPLSFKVQENFQKVGFALLVGLMVFATYNDIFRLVAPMFGVRH